MRQWWRRSGRNQQFPVDGVSGATKPAGKHALAFNAAAKPLAQLKPGQYAVVVEAAREVGGRELLRIPSNGRRRRPNSARGEHELGAIALDLKP